MQKQSSGVSQPVYGRPSAEAVPKTLTESHFLKFIPITDTQQNLKKKMCGMHRTWKKERIYLLV
jgi:hypothetical protein